MSTSGALFTQAMHCHQNRDLLRAEALYRQVLQVDPRHAHAANNLGLILRDKGQPAEAARYHRQALQSDPRHAIAHNNLGNALRDLGDFAEAAACYRQALRLDPYYADACNNLGLVCKDQGQLVEAAACFEQALRLAPQHADAHGNLATALISLGQLPAASRHNEEALRLQPSGMAFFRRAQLRLLQGDLAGGWPEYEQRWALPNARARSFAQPRWDGSPPAGKTILVFHEQGFGDTLQFVRYFKLFEELDCQVVFECQPALHELLSGVAGLDLLVAEGMPLPPHDLQVPLLSLPGIFGTTVDTIPAAIPYLHADAGRIEHWRRELASPEKSAAVASALNESAAPTLNIGIAWQGNPKFSGDRWRSIPLTCFDALAGIPGVRLVSLQKGHGTEQLQAPPRQFPVLELGSRLESFSDTAAVVKNLDLVISSCTAVAHLAGALGVPVWTALQFVPDWRWFLAREDSPWYPTMRLFRQHRFGDWQEVFARMAAELRKGGLLAPNI